MTSINNRNSFSYSVSCNDNRLCMHSIIMLPEAFNNRADANNSLQTSQFVFSVANALVTDLLKSGYFSFSLNKNKRHDSRRISSSDISNIGYTGCRGSKPNLTFIAYRKRDLDYKHMYLQCPFDLVTNCKRLNQSARWKATTVFFFYLSFHSAQIYPYHPDQV